MNGRLRILWVMVLILIPSWGASQSFAGLGTAADGFAVPAPDPEFEFPSDHGAHPDYRIEWWYLTANLKSADGTDYGLQWTLFRSALGTEGGEGWATPQLWMGHAAVTTPTDHYVSERFGRGGIGQAGVTADPFSAWIDDWELSGNWDQLRMTASGEDFRYDMALLAQGPLIFHGDQGYSVKSANGQASYYYSQPFFEISGTLSLPEGDIAVTGNGWLDREWSSQPLAENQTGWDWFSLSFDDGAKLMGFRLLQTDGAHFTSATWIAANGETTAYADGAFQADPIDTHKINSAEVPVKWRVQLPQKDVNVYVEAINPNAWMSTAFPYWEGPVRVSGSHAGYGYLEMTGYE